MRAYMAVVGLRVLGGYDVADRHGREHPELIVKIIRTAVTADTASRQAAAEDALQNDSRAGAGGASRAVRRSAARSADDLPGARRARLPYRHARGGRGAARGARRGRAVEGARPRARRRRIWWTPRPTRSSRCSRDGQGPRADELAQRVRWRLETPLSAAPAELGHPPSTPPPAEWFPPDRRAAAADHDPRDEPDVRRARGAARRETARLKGFPVSPGVYEGPVRVITSIEELPDVQQGEVLVATSTGSTFNVVLPLIGALVTERGGVLSHAAIVSREYGLPGVVGCVGATTTVEDRHARARGRGQGRGMDADLTLVPLHDAHHEPAFGGKAVEPWRGDPRRTAGAAGRGARRGVGRSRGGGGRGGGRGAARVGARPGRAAGRAVVGRRRGFRGRELRGAACDEAERPKAAAPATPSASSGQSARTESALAYRATQRAGPRRRAWASSCRLLDRAGGGRRAVHPQPDHRRRRAPDRGLLGTRRGGGQRRRGPDRVRLDPRRPRARASTVGDKDIKVWYDEEDGTMEVPVDPALQTRSRASSRCTSTALHDLAARCAARVGTATSTSSGRSAATARIYPAAVPADHDRPRVKPRFADRSSRRRRSAPRSPRSIRRWWRWRCRR